MTCKNLLTLFIAGSCWVFAFGQQLPQYSLYMLNPAQFNPAYAGLEGSLNFTGVFRKQWVNLNGSPSQQNLTAQMPLYFLSSGIGFVVENDILGARRFTSATLQYNYQIPTGKIGQISVGLSAGFTRFNWDGNKLRTPDGNYEDNVFDHNDDFLPSTNVSASAPSLGLGIFYKDEKLETGISVQNLYSTPMEIGNAEISLGRHFLFFGEYKIDFGNNFSLLPSVLVKSDLTEHQTDFSLIIDYNGNIFGGGAVRGFSSQSIDAAGIIGGWRLSEQITLAYVYDFPISPLGSVQQGSHEVLLNYNLNKPLGKGKLPKIIFNPRFL